MRLLRSGGVGDALILPPDEGERVRTGGRVESRFVALPERFFQLYIKSFSSVFVFHFVFDYFVFVLRGVDRDRS